MNELALFAGAGGGILGGILLGWKCVCAVELDPYCRSVLLARQRDGVLPVFPIWDDVRTFDGRPWRGHVDVVTGGFPCQDISCAGKGAGIAGERSGLWSDMARIISEVRPRFVLVENSPLLVSRGLTRVLSDLATLGYDARWGVVGARHVGAPHRRDRIWIVAQRSQRGCREGWPRRLDPGDSRESEQALSYMADAPSGEFRRREQQSESGKAAGNVADNSHSSVANAARGGCKGQSGNKGPRQAMRGWIKSCGENLAAIGTYWWDRDPADAEGSAESGMGRMAHGLAHRVDRLKALGNGQVPAVVRLAWEILTDDLPHPTP